MGRSAERISVVAKGWIVGACIGVAAVIAAPVPGHAKSLAEVVGATIAAHPEVRRDQARNRAAEELIDEQFSGYLPTLDLDAGTGYEFSNSPAVRNQTGGGRNETKHRDLWRSDLQLRLNQMVFDGFATRSGVRSARADRDAAIERIAETNQRIGFRAVEVFLGVLRNQDVVGLADENVAALEDIVRRVRGQDEVGVADNVDLEQSAARMALSLSEQSRRMGGLRRANVQFTEVVGEAPDSLELPAAPDYDRPIDIDAAISDALKDNPTVAVTAARVRARTHDIGVTRAPYFPRLDVELTGTTINNLDGILGPNTTFSALLRMRYNLFRGFFDRASKRRATFEAAAAADDDSEARRSIREDVRVAYRALMTAQARLVPLRQRVESSKRTLDAYYGQYDLGRRSLFDLLDTQNELFRSSVDLVDGKFAVLLGHYRLLFSMGRLLQSLGVEPATV